MTLDNGDPVRVPMTPQSGLTLMGAAGGVVSCVNDLLQLYRVMLRACVHQFENSVTSTPNNPFKQLTTSMSPHTILPGRSYRETTYGMGWTRTQLPKPDVQNKP